MDNETQTQLSGIGTSERVETTMTVFDCHDNNTIDSKEDGDEDEGDNNFKDKLEEANKTKRFK